MKSFGSRKEKVQQIKPVEYGNCVSQVKDRCWSHPIGETNIEIHGEKEKCKHITHEIGKKFIIGMTVREIR
ncbi:MAG: hypothetical protein QXS01_05300 [Candidatus Bathyarchaeia archaeon]